MSVVVTPAFGAHAGLQTQILYQLLISPAAIGASPVVVGESSGLQLGIVGGVLQGAFDQVFIIVAGKGPTDDFPIMEVQVSFCGLKCTTILHFKVHHPEDLFLFNLK